MAKILTVSSATATQSMRTRVYLAVARRICRWLADLAMFAVESTGSGSGRMGYRLFATLIAYITMRGFAAAREEHALPARVDAPLRYTPYHATHWQRHAM